MLALHLPAVVVVDDYHKLPQMEEDFALITQGGRIKVVQLGADSKGWFAHCVGLAYTGRLPSKKVIAALLEAKDTVLRTDEVVFQEYIWKGSRFLWVGPPDGQQCFIQKVECICRCAWSWVSTRTEASSIFLNAPLKLEH